MKYKIYSQNYQDIYLWTKNIDDIINYELTMLDSRVIIYKFSNYPKFMFVAI